MCMKSMLEDGDIVFARKQDSADEGQIIVALIQDSATLKRYYLDGKHHKVRLHPENKAMSDIIVDHCVIQGVAVKVIKNIS